MKPKRCNSLKRWKPGIGERYWFSIDIRISSITAKYFNDDYVDRTRYEWGNMFRTRRDAVVMLKKIEKVMRGS